MNLPLKQNTAILEALIKHFSGAPYPTQITDPEVENKTFETEEELQAALKIPNPETIEECATRLLKKFLQEVYTFQTKSTDSIYE